MEEETLGLLRTRISSVAYREDSEALHAFFRNPFPQALMVRIRKRADFILRVMRKGRYANWAQALLGEYTLSSLEGVCLMTLAEALLRIPDVHHIDQLIYEKIIKGNWWQHLSAKKVLPLNLVALGLASASLCLKVPFLHKLSMPLVRFSLDRAVRLLSQNFVMSAHLQESIARTTNHEKTGYLRYSYDMLGEAARTQAQADDYYFAYKDAISQVGVSMNKALGPLEDGAPVACIMRRSGISIKLSALHPRYEGRKVKLLKETLVPRLLALLQEAQAYNINVTIDAEEAKTLDVALEIFECVKKHPSLMGYNGLGFVVQAYLKNAPRGCYLSL